jgi:hypothetical protein
MGSRNLDRITMTQWRQRCETVGQMLGLGWRDVRAACPDCHRHWPVDLDRVARSKGPAVSLWNRTQRCRSPQCPGAVRFEVKIPGTYRHQVMIAGDTTKVFTPPLGERPRPKLE